MNAYIELHKMVSRCLAPGPTGYLLAFNEDYTELMYAWRMSTWIIIDKDKFKVGLSSSYEFNVVNMKEYYITDKIKRGVIWEGRILGQ